MKRMKANGIADSMIDPWGDSYSLWQSVPVACDGHIARDPQGKDDLSKANRVAVPQVEAPVPINPDRIDAIIIPIARHRLVPRQPIIERNVRKPGAVDVLQENDPVARTEDAGCIFAIAIPIPGESHIARIAQIKAYLSVAFRIA